MPFNLTFDEKQSLNSLESKIDYHNKKCDELHQVIRNILDENMLKACLREYKKHAKEVHIVTTQRKMFIDGLIEKYHIDE